MTLLAGNPQNAAAYLQPLYSGPTHTLKIYHIFILLSLILLEESILGSFSKDCHLSKCPCQTQSSGYLCTLSAVLQISSMYNWKRRSRYSEQRGELSAWSPIERSLPFPRSLLFCLPRGKSRAVSIVWMSGMGPLLLQGAASLLCFQICNLPGVCSSEITRCGTRGAVKH